jgi:hypothetical protein
MSDYCFFNWRGSLFCHGARAFAMLRCHCRRTPCRAAAARFAPLTFCAAAAQHMALRRPSARLCLQRL